MNDHGELWQVEVDGQVYDTDIETLKQWVLEGAVQPGDRVRRGALKWLEAQRVPALRGVFAGEDLPASPAPPPGGVGAPSYTDPGAIYGSDPGGAAAFAAPDPGGYAGGPAEPPGPAMTYGAAAAPAAAPSYGPAARSKPACVNHPDVAPKSVCTSCGTAFCRPCCKMVNNVPLCSLCGSLCRPFEEVSAKQQAASSLSAGFGLEDFVRAVAYPFSDKVSLVIACGFYGFMSMIPHVYATLFSYGVLFASMSYIINRVSMGKLEGGLLPDFSDSLFETIYGSARLAAAVSIITFGPLVVLVFAFGGAIGMDDPATFFAGVGAAALVGVVWAIFYYPMALLVAGFTRSFFAVVNPVVGLDTIYRMGLIYVKAYVMCVAVYLPMLVFRLVMNGVIEWGSADGRAVGQAALTIFFGNMLVGSAMFYVAAVVSCILGLAIWKAGDRLGVR